MPRLMTHSVFNLVRVYLHSSAVALLAVLAIAAGAAPVLAAEAYERGLLWRVEGKGPAPSHVFGTVHLADPRVTKLPPAVARELDQASSVSLEITLDTANIATLANRMLYTDGRDLQSVAGADLFGKALAITAELGLPEPVLRMFKPWAVALVLSAPPQDPAQVLDFILAQRARDQGKPVHQLEGMEEQIAVLEGFPEADQVALLRHAVENRGRIGDWIGRIVEAYLARDLAAMQRISEESAGGDPRVNEIYTERLLYQRNERMAERMEARLAEGRAFMAVGALHLYGARGVLALLEQRGYRVTRVY
jgi:uncharacterized protein